MPTKPAPTESKLATFLMGTVIGLVTLLVTGGYWLQQQRSDDAALRRQADAYDSYLQHTTPTQLHTPPLQAAPAHAQQVRQQLLNHPAVVPGPGFDKPGVQSTGKMIIDAIEGTKTY